MKLPDEIKAVLDGESEGCIVQGDCLEVMSTMPDGCVDAVVTDIPYGEVNRHSNGLRTLDKLDADVVTFDLNVLADLFGRLSTGSVYAFCGTEQVSGIRKALVSLGLSTRLCVWEKTNPSPMNGEHLWLSSIEACVFGKKPGATFTRKCESPVFRFPVCTNQVHPTQKPIGLMCYLTQSSTNQGDIILDPFCGSGTTCVAAKKLGRRYIGIELSEKYCRIASNRVQNTERPLFTGGGE
jgi:DNA modification methylase